jgi:hypothetical protein
MMDPQPRSVLASLLTRVQIEYYYILLSMITLVDGLVWTAQKVFRLLTSIYRSDPAVAPLRVYPRIARFHKDERGFGYQ